MLSRPKDYSTHRNSIEEKEMKKIFPIMLIAMMAFSALPVTSAFAGDVAYQENVIDKMSDWAATAGKDKTERDMILAKRKAERQKKHAAKKAVQMKKKAEKKAKEMGKDAKSAKKDMKKKMGL